MCGTPLRSEPRDRPAAAPAVPAGSDDEAGGIDEGPSLARSHRRLALPAGARWRYHGIGSRAEGEGAHRHRGGHELAGVRGVATGGRARTLFGGARKTRRHGGTNPTTGHFVSRELALESSPVELRWAKAPEERNAGQRVWRHVIRFRAHRASAARRFVAGTGLLGEG